MNRHLFRFLVATVFSTSAAFVIHAEPAPLHNPHVRHGLEISAQGSSVIVSSGECEISGRPVTVAGPVTLTVPPAPSFAVTNESVRLSVEKPAGYSKGSRLQGLRVRDVNACGSLVRGSLELRRSKEGERLKEGEDYLLDADWGHVGLGPKSRVTATDTVFASYRASMLRLDTIQISSDGKVTLKVGEPHISIPVAPEPEPGALALAHVYMTYQATEVSPSRIYVIAETAAQAVTGSTPNRIPKTLAKIKAGEPVTIVSWGDSVTAGGNASKPELAYVGVFGAGLKERFPSAKIEVKNISVGGSNSRQWLYPDKFPFHGKPPTETGVTFQRIVDAKPNLVTIEFVNDAGMTPAQVEEVYSDILNRIQGLGAEVILITPHFTMPKMMGFKSEGEPEHRPYVLALREFAGKHQIALADASARWEHLWKEGIPYLTLLHNTINHPDDRGHRLFAEELWKCFAP